MRSATENRNEGVELKFLTPSDDNLDAGNLESRVTAGVCVCLWLAFGIQFMDLGELSELQRTSLGVSSFVLFPGFLVLPGAYFGPMPGFVISLIVWVAIARKAARNWRARKSRSNKA